MTRRQEASWKSKNWGARCFGVTPPVPLLIEYSELDLRS